MKIAIVTFTKKGADIAEGIMQNMDEIFYVYKKGLEPLNEWVCHMFNTCHALIFVGAAGIAIRLIKDCIDNKAKDPAVIVVDELGKFAIPILSGHLGGANALAIKISSCINSTPVITTSTDINNKFAVDLWSTENNCIIDDTSLIKNISAAILADEKVGFFSDFPIDGDLPQDLVHMDNGKLGICVSIDAQKKPFDVTLNLIPKIVTLGIGSKRGVDFFVLEKVVLDVLAKNNISMKSVSAVTSIDLKKDEPSIIMLGEKYNIPFVTYSAAKLNSLIGNFSSSEFVKDVTGVDSVCERSALFKSKGRLLLSKTTDSGVAVALAVNQYQCCFKIL